MFLSQDVWTRGRHLLILIEHVQTQLLYTVRPQLAVPAPQATTGGPLQHSVHAGGAKLRGVVPKAASSVNFDFAGQVKLP